MASGTCTLCGTDFALIRISPHSPSHSSSHRSTKSPTRFGPSASITTPGNGRARNCSWKTIRSRQPPGCVDHCCSQPRPPRRATCSPTQAAKRLNEMAEIAEQADKPANDTNFRQQGHFERTDQPLTRLSPFTGTIRPDYLRFTEELETGTGRKLYRPGVY